MLVTDSGASDKDVVKSCVKKILRLRRELEIDASDALAVAISHGKTLVDSELEAKSV